MKKLSPLELKSKPKLSNPRVLFILKKRNESWGQDDGYSSCGKFSSGLYNSANFVKNMLVKNGIEAKLIEVFDNNFIDREVKSYQPTHVILEAVWVIPEKFEILQKLHPKVKWIIRNHSEVPFLSMEGNGFDWLLKYSKHKNVFISNNSKNIQKDFVELVRISNKLSPREAEQKVIYLPNYYPVSDEVQNFKHSGRTLNIGCFSAIRPLKNILIQAIAAIRFAESQGKFLNFHVNSTRIEGRGDAVLKNLQLLFSHFPGHFLVEHEWQPHQNFLKLIKKMDLVLQVSLSETFNIVAADSVSVGTPIVVSPEIKWASCLNQANCTNTEDIIKVMNRVFKNKFLVYLNKFMLKGDAIKAEKIWLEYFK